MSERGQLRLVRVTPGCAKATTRTTCPDKYLCSRGRVGRIAGSRSSSRLPRARMGQIWLSYSGGFRLRCSALCLQIQTRSMAHAEVENGALGLALLRRNPGMILMLVVAGRIPANRAHLKDPLLR